MQSLLYYDEDGYSRPLKLTRNSIFSALNAIYAGKGVPKHSENVLERIARVRILRLGLNICLFLYPTERKQQGPSVGGIRQDTHQDNYIWHCTLYSATLLLPQV